MRILKFFSTSVIATTVDLILYTSLVRFVSPVISNVISAGTGLLINFILQRRFVFNPGNSLYKSFVLSLMFSFMGFVLGTALIYVFTTYTVLKDSPVVAKLITVGLIFFYNYATRKIAFAHQEEKKSDYPC